MVNRKRVALGVAVWAVVWLVGVAPAADVPPPGVPTAELKELGPGTTWTMSVDDGRGAPRKYTATVATGVYEGRPVYRVGGGSTTFIYDKATFNMIARLSGDRPAFSMQPHEGKFTWPLWVGRTWTTSFTATDHSQNRSFADVTSQWKVVTYEDITVPAGTFKAFRVQSSSVRNQSVTYTTWYAPDPGLIVKEIVERGQTNYTGAGKTSYELIDYKLP